VGQYVALLRGINVGGKNLIKMPALKACFERLGLRDVITYIQSGNVLFASPERGNASLARRIEDAVAEAFAYPASLVLRSRMEMEATVAHAPRGFGKHPAQYRYDVVFLKPPLQAQAVVGVVPTREGVDRAYAGPGVIYFSRLISKTSQSRLSKMMSLPIYQSMTIRNWNTTTTLLRMMAGPEE
jgi:uncharacterized protein (DUF1697 family)